MSASIRLLRKEELALANKIFRISFGTFNGHPEPEKYGSDLNYMKRWFTDPSAAFGAEIDEKLVGSNFAINWGSFGLFGPLTVHPDFWGQGIAQQLIEPALECFTRWEIKHAGFFTFPNSPQHLWLYQKFGFYPRFLTALMVKSVQLTGQKLQGFRYSELSPARQFECLKASLELTDAVYNELDVRSEIRAVEAQQLGDTIFLWDDSRLVSFAICHCGQDTEAGSDTCYIKFGAVRPGLTTGQDFEQLIQECEALCAREGVTRLVCGVNTGRQEAYQQMQALGFRIERLGLAMHKPNEPAFNRPDVYVVDDWR